MLHQGELYDIRDDIAFFEEVRVWMAKFDAEERRAKACQFRPTSS